MKKNPRRLFVFLVLWGGFAALTIAAPAASADGAGNITFGFSLSGGMANINGGDFNRTIRDYNTWAMDYNDYFGDDYYTIDWQEMKWLPKFGGEFLTRFGRHFGVGLGLEYIKKTNVGHMDYIDEFYQEYDYFGIAYIAVDDNYYQYNTITQTLTVIPITLSFYGYLPLGPRAEAYVKAGAGYYLGKITSDWLEDWDYYYNENWYWYGGTPWPPHYHDKAEGAYTESFEATCNTLGFHFGAGLNFNVSGHISLFAEAFYRMVNFKDWRGSGGWSTRYDEYWGYTGSTGSDGLPNHYHYDADDSYNGKLWSYDDLWDYLDQGSYLMYGVYEAGNEPVEGPWTDNVKPTEIDLNGFTFKVGLKIFFGGRR
jgi:hypothetical protein